MPEGLRGLGRGPELLMRIRVYLNAATVLTLLARKGKAHGGRKWLAMRLRVTPAMVTFMMQNASPVPAGMDKRIMEAFKGTTLDRHRRVGWDDLFKTQLLDSSGSAI